MRASSLASTIAPVGNCLFPLLNTAESQHFVLSTPLLTLVVSTDHLIPVAKPATTEANSLVERSGSSFDADLAVVKKAAVAISVGEKAESWIHLCQHVSLKVLLQLCLLVSKIVDVVHDVSWKKRKERALGACVVGDLHVA